MLARSRNRRPVTPPPPFENDDADVVVAWEEIIWRLLLLLLLLFPQQLSGLNGRSCCIPRLFPTVAAAVAVVPLIGGCKKAAAAETAVILLTRQTTMQSFLDVKPLERITCRDRIIFSWLFSQATDAGRIAHQARRGAVFGFLMGPPGQHAGLTMYKTGNHS
jgi:hypothetical protein